MKVNKKIIVFALFVLLVIALGIKFFVVKPKNNKNAAIPVVIATALQKNIPVSLTAIGNVAASQRVDIKSQVTGTLQTTLFKEGQFVKAGEPLFLIDPRPFEVLLQQANANFAKDNAQYINAKNEVKRYSSLLKKGYVTKENYDQIVTMFKMFEASLQADNAAISTAELQLSYCKIVSPISGRTGALTVNAGNLVKAVDTTGLVTINQINPVYVNFALPEKVFPQLSSLIQTHKISVAAYAPTTNDELDKGELTLIDNQIDPSTGTIALRATFPNLKLNLWPGQFVNINVMLSPMNNVIVVPAQSVTTGQQGQYVYIINAKNKAEYRLVKTSITYNNETVITAGVKVGEHVVSNGQFRLTPGATVSLVNTSTPESKKPIKHHD